MSKRKDFTEEEENFINTALRDLEYKILCEWGLKNINGSFVNIDILDYDDEAIYVEVTGGSQDDTGSDVSSHKETLDRKTLESIG